MKSPKACPTAETILAYAAGALAPDAAGRVEEHMNTGCDSCKGRLDDVERLRRLSAGADLSEVPEWVSRRAAAIPGGALPLSYLNGALVHDTFRDPLPLGARSAASDARHMLYSAGEFDLNVRVTPSGAGRVRVVGQALAPEGGEPLPSGQTEVVLAGDGVGMVALPLDDFGGFAFDDVPEGTYELTVAAPTYRFVVPNLAAYSHREAL